jgi:hypothetical protein
MLRMTIQELAAQPWLNQSVSSRNNTPLSSPLVLANKDQWAEVKQAYALEMTQLRMGDKEVMLKPISSANNAMVHKRKKRYVRNTFSNSDCYMCETLYTGDTVCYGRQEEEEV